MKKILLPLFALAALASCSKSETPATPDTPQDGVIRIFTGVEAPGSKAVVSQATGLTGAQFVRVEGNNPTDFSSTATNYAHTAGAVAATSGAVTFTTAPKYNMSDANSWFVAYYPVGSLANNVVTWGIDGHTDILRTDTKWDAGKFSVPVTSGMTFNHQLSQVEVVCKAEDGSAISAVHAAWGKIKSIEFVDAPTAMTYTLSSLAIANGTTTKNFPLLSDYDGTAFPAAGLAIPVSNNSTVNAKAMLAPITPTSEASFQLKITTEGATNTGVAQAPIVQTVNVSLDGTKGPMVKGKTHTVTLTFKADAKNITVSGTTIDAWGDGADGTNDVTKP